MNHAALRLSHDIKARRRFLIASSAMPVVYVLLAGVHWFLEVYIRGWDGHHWVYGLFKPFAFGTSLLMIVVALVLTGKVVLANKRLGALWTTLCVLLALVPILLIASGISLFL